MRPLPGRTSTVPERRSNGGGDEEDDEECVDVDDASSTPMPPPLPAHPAAATSSASPRRNSSSSAAGVRIESLLRLALATRGAISEGRRAAREPQLPGLFFFGAKENERERESTE
jgi:hypothetical protein